jgi:3-isopropylmalate dehydrogenase
MASHNILLLPGDGIGPEVCEATGIVIDWFSRHSGTTLRSRPILSAEPPMTRMAKRFPMRQWAGPWRLMRCCSVRWAGRNGMVCPMTSALKRGSRLRKDMDLFANLRPAICYPALAGASSLKPELVEGLDILILRELTGGVYFGEPKEVVTLENGEKRAVDTQVYTTGEIARIARVAFDLARTRGKHVTSMEKRNVMKSGVLWNEVVSDIHVGEGYVDVKLDHMLADAGAMQLVRAPSSST